MVLARAIAPGLSSGYNQVEPVTAENAVSQIAPRTSYDDVPYPDLCYTQSHPDRLAVCGALLGMTPAPVTACRVLELGCAGGGNLLPMSAALPGSTFVGIDNSPRQIEAANAAVGATGLSNAAFFAMDIRDVTPALGAFDYIIAHGVYSWVPPPVRDALLNVCSANLAPQGIAYVSYNALPGWHALLGLREMMLFHGRNETSGHARAQKARELVSFLSDAIADERNQAYGTFMDSYRELLEKQQQDGRPQVDSVLLHDELSEYNDPTYFHQFAAHAGRHGLQFLIEAELPMSMPQNLSSELFQALQEMSDSIVATEQYMDFVRNRAFRRTLLCHASVPIDRTLHAASVRGMAIATRARRLPVRDQDGVSRRYEGPDGAVFQSDEPLSIAAFEYLGEIAPQAVPFGVLVSEAGQRLAAAPPSEADVERLAANLLRAHTYSVSLLELHAWVPPFVSVVSERPVAAPYARYQARISERVANQRHERVVLDPLGQYVVPYLDGTRTRDDLCELLDGLVQRGALRIRGAESDRADTQAMQRRVRGELGATLVWLSQTGLLIG
jgi:methyltransferase-like protein/SAM-dependent methyltransferase